MCAAFTLGKVFLWHDALMRIIQNIAPQQAQTLAMTQQLQQAIRLLELPNLELAAYLKQALLENPVLDGITLTPEESQAHGTEDVPPVHEEENLWSSGDRPRALPTGSEDWMQHTPAPAQSLHASIEEQIALLPLTPHQKLLAARLCDYLETSGYLAPEYREIESILGCTADELEEVVAQLQALEPLGVFARTLAECLRPQLAAQNALSRPMALILENLSCIAQGTVPAFLRRHQITAEEFQTAMAQIRSLDPRPGGRYHTTASGEMIPDACLEQGPSGWVVRLNAQTLPQILLNQGYVTHMSRHVHKPDDQRYLRGCVQNAHFLINALHKRADTLMRVCTEIARRQSAFFQHGLRYLVPMSLKDLSESLELHESTISRVTSQKYIQTPRGTYALKYFFSNAVATIDGGGSCTSQSIKDQIKKLIAQEKPAKPLSDDDLVQLVRAQGIQIARRTVAKYREAAQIPSSYERRRSYLVQGI